MSAHISMAVSSFEGSHVHDCWSPPPYGWVKINCDASRCQATKLSVMTAIFRNHEGYLVGGLSSSCFTSSACLVEASAIRMRVPTVVNKGFKSVIIKSDNKGLINRLSNYYHSV
ncbi:hypothetical protein V6N13_147019 [Hibiscus sabdariffa]|uniref:RNase H type-1 domain-containing protein n=1 Tax=Hibiscus sabdariffa TaxID=183260 RepID=A0ABR2TUK5_9ROSI